MPLSQTSDNQHTLTARISYLAAAAMLFMVSSLMAAAFTAGNIVVYRVSDGTAALSGAAAPVFVDEYTTEGVLVQSIAMPTTV